MIFIQYFILRYFVKKMFKSLKNYNISLTPTSYHQIEKDFMMIAFLTLHKLFFLIHFLSIYYLFSYFYLLYFILLYHSLILNLGEGIIHSLKLILSQFYHYQILQLHMEFKLYLLLLALINYL